MSDHTTIFSCSNCSHAHRAGAREAITTLAEWVLGVMKHDQCGDGPYRLRACQDFVDAMKARYAEPEEEKKG